MKRILKTTWKMACDHPLTIMVSLLSVPSVVTNSPIVILGVFIVSLVFATEHVAPSKS